MIRKFGEFILVGSRERCAGDTSQFKAEVHWDRYGCSMHLTKHLNELVYEGCLRQHNGPFLMLPFDGNSYDETDTSQIRNSPCLTHLTVEAVVFSLGTGNREEIVHMYRGYDGARTPFAIIDTRLTGESSKTPSYHTFIHGCVPDTTALFHAIQTTLQFSHPILLSRLLKTNGLLHILNLLFR